LDLKTAEVVAIKKLKRQYDSLEDAFSLREISMLQSVSHPNIIELKRVELERSKVYMVFEHLDCNLTDFMREKKKSEHRSLTE
jgi:serine/threonine protein kinase